MTTIIPDYRQILLTLFSGNCLENVLKIGSFANPSISPGYCDVSLLQRDLAGPVCGVERGVDPLPELGRSDEEEVPLLVGRDEDVVLVLALLLAAVPEGGDAVAVLAVVVPLALVLEAVGPLADAEARPLVVLPLAHVRLGHVGVEVLILEEKKETCFNPRVRLRLSASD